MKQPVSTSGLLQLLLLLSLSLTSTVQADQDIPPTLVSYDKIENLLTISAETASLKSVLNQIAAQSGIEVMFDEGADEPLSINIQSMPLKKALEQILRGNSHIMRYDRDKKGNSLLIGVMVLPKGQEDNSHASPLLNQNNEAYHYARKQANDTDSNGLDEERWQARLAEMSSKQREQLEQYTAQRQTRKEEKEKRRQKQKEDMAADQKESDAHKTERLQYQQGMLNALKPEQRSRYEQAGELAREQILQQLQNN